MPLKLYNTLSGKNEEFTPPPPYAARMYHCGPTVYNYAHIGNLRSYVFADVLRRTFEYNGYEVRQVINITDVGHLSSDADEGEDKMTKALRREGKPLTLAAMREVGEFYANAFIADLKALNILLPHEMPRASDHIEEDIELIKILEEKTVAYKTSDGIYFDVSRYPEYGKLGKIQLAGQKSGARVGVNSEKKNPADFALWKFSSSSPIGSDDAQTDPGTRPASWWVGTGRGAERTRNYAGATKEKVLAPRETSGQSPQKNSAIGWDSPWGKGFPGWHIECSAMSAKYLGQPFDIHTGGIDHIGVHHQNEIAQSEAAFGKPLARFWMHNGFVNIKDPHSAQGFAGQTPLRPDFAEAMSGKQDSAGQRKMAKSEGNILTLAELQKKGLTPLAYRYWLLGAHYQTPMEWSGEAMAGAKNSYEKLADNFLLLEIETGEFDEGYQKKFREAVSDDLGTPLALSLLWEVLGDSKLPNKNKRATLLDFDRVLGLGLANLRAEPIPEEVQALAKEREAARSFKDWKTSDRLREKIEAMGYEIRDEAGVPILRKL